MRYTLLLHYPEMSAADLGSEALADGMREFDEYAKALDAAGVLQSAEVLQPSSATTTVRGGDELRVQDGPFADTKEQLGGTFVIEVDDLDQAMAAHSIEALSGALFDLGVSSPQLDQPDRGFSYRNAGPLDMRMDTDAPWSADDVVNGYSEAELARVIKDHGDERFARRIAAAIVASRSSGCRSLYREPHDSSCAHCVGTRLRSLGMTTGSQ